MKNLFLATAFVLALGIFAPTPTKADGTDPMPICKYGTPGCKKPGGLLQPKIRLSNSCSVRPATEQDAQELRQLIADGGPLPMCPPTCPNCTWIFGKIYCKKNL